MAGRMRRSGAQADGKRGDNRAAMKPAGYYRALPRRFRNRPVLIVGCGDGSLCITELQKPGGKRLPAADFLRGMPIAAGSRFD